LLELQEQEVNSLADVKLFSGMDLEETIHQIKPPRRRAAVRSALLPFTATHKLNGSSRFPLHSPKRSHHCAPDMNNNS
jgi:hypothetical protein